MGSKEFDVIIIGGSYAGLSAAMTLGRSLRRTLVIDSGKPCNRQTPHSHNFLTQDGHTPKEISDISKSQVSKYDSIEFYNGLAVSGRKVIDGFEIKTSNGDSFKAKKLVFATGIKDLLPNISGFTECWAISIVHCPYCHGYEIRNKKTAVIANGEQAFHLLPLVYNLTKKLTLLTSGEKNINEAQLPKLAQHDIQIIEKPIEKIEHNDGQLQKIVFKDGSAEEFECAYWPVPFEQNSTIPQDLGCQLTEQGYLAIDAMQKTSEEGIFACGDNSTMLRSVANAVYSGNITGAIINKQLSEECF